MSKNVDNFSMLFTEHLEELRSYKKKSKEQFAAEIGISSRYYSYLTVGKRKLSLNKAYEISVELGISFKDLIENAKKN